MRLQSEPWSQDQFEDSARTVNITAPAPSICHYPALPMSSVPPPTFPSLNPMSRPSASTLPAMDSTHINFMASLADTNMAEAPTATHTTMDPHASGALSFPPRATDSAYSPYPQHFAHASMGPAPYHGNDPTGAYTNGHVPPPAGAANTMYGRFESVGDLLSPDSPDFKYNANLDAVLHTGKCQECVRFGIHLLMPGNAVKYLQATRAHGDVTLGPLRAEIDRLTQSARIAARNTDELRDALQSHQQRESTLTDNRDKARRDYDDLLTEKRNLEQRVWDLEQQLAATPRPRPHSPVRLVRHHSPTRAGARSGTPYERPGPRRTAQSSGRRPRARAPIVSEPDSEGDVIMATRPTGTRSVRMHANQSGYSNARPCPEADYRWRASNSAEMVGLPRTRAGTPYLPTEVGLGWYRLEHGAATATEVYRRINLLFRNRKEEVWLAAARGAFEFRRFVRPLPEVMEHLIQLHRLRKSAWAIINDGVANGAELSIVSPGCRLLSSGYAGLYTPDVELWAVIHAATDVDSSKLSAATGRTATTADLKKMLKDAICSGNYFEIKPAELARGRYKLPRLAHYDGPLDMNSIVKWLRDTISMTPFMVHAHFRPYLRRVYEASPDDIYREFSPTRLSAGESVAPVVNDSLADFPESCDWTPNRSPRERLCLPMGTSADAPSVPSATTTSPTPSSLSAPDDTEMANCGGTSANAPLVPP